MVEEARLEDYGSGLAPKTEGWFVVNVRDAAWDHHDAFGASCMFESRDAEFTELGIRICTLLPGQPNGLYHGEETQEDFLVLSGECLLLVEGEERRLRAWDFFHCAPSTEHILVGAGEGPCAILMTGTRRAWPPDLVPGLGARASAQGGSEDGDELAERRRTPATETSVSSARRTGISCPGRSAKPE